MEPTVKRGAIPAVNGSSKPPVLVASRKPCPFFDVHEAFARIDQWPDLDEPFRQKASELLSKSMRDFKCAFGIYAPDGRPTLGEHSQEASRILADIIERGRCFRFVDAAGMQWGMIVESDDRDSWKGTAVGVNFELGMLNRPSRLAYRDLILQRLNELGHPGQPSTPDTLRTRTAYCRVRRWLATLDDAMAVAIELFDVAYLFRPQVDANMRALANSVWGSDGLSWPSSWQMRVFDAFGLLGGMQVQTLRLSKTGWRPHPLTRRPAVSFAAWSDEEEETLKVYFAPEFVQFLSHWLWPSAVDPNDPASTFMGNFPRIEKVPFDVDA